jgi:signal transduction histidine kinase
MGRPGRTRLLPLAVGAALLALLAVLAIHQYMWIGQVSILQSQRLHAALLGAGTAFADDFDHEVTRAFVAFRPMVPETAADEPGRGPDAHLAARVARQYEAWRVEAPFPRLIRDIFYLDADPDGALAGGPGGAPGAAGGGTAGPSTSLAPGAPGAPGAAGAPALAALQGQPPRFAAVPWTPELADLRRRLGQGGRDGGPYPPPAAPGIPGLLIPAWWRLHGGAAGPAGHPGEPVAGGYLIVRFDAAAIRAEVLPELTRRHFGSSWGVQDALAVVEGAGAGAPPRVIFLSDPALPAAAFRTGDLVLPLFAVRHFGPHGAGAAFIGSSPPAPHFQPADGEPPHGTPQPGRDMAPGQRQGAGPPWMPRPEETSGPPDRHGPAVLAELGAVPPRAAWALVVRRRDGSLEEAVAHFRHRNLAVGAALVALAALTTALMTVATQRAQRLARQQMEFVAAITHELNTPLTAIRSAGQNLADGVVAEPAQVRRYGELILGEGRRLSGLVSQVLDFAGIESGRQTYSLEITELGEVIAGALEDCRPLLAERRARVESHLAPRLPPVSADPAALRRALRNLIENAAKYGGPDPWIGIQARQDGGEVAITVEDHGAGIRREDLPHLFEPFFRGRQTGAGRPAGSGLGLSVVHHIVRAHRGRVTCASGGARRGTAFTLHLPAAAGRAS